MIPTNVQSVTSQLYLTWILGSTSSNSDSSLSRIGCLPHNNVTLPKILHCTCIDGYLSNICQNLVRFKRTCSHVCQNTQHIASTVDRCSCEAATMCSLHRHRTRHCHSLYHRRHHRSCVHSAPSLCQAAIAALPFPYLCTATLTIAAIATIDTSTVRKVSCESWSTRASQRKNGNGSNLAPVVRQKPRTIAMHRHQSNAQRKTVRRVVHKLRPPQTPKLLHQ